MFLYEKTHRYLKNNYQFFDAWKTKDCKIRGNCNLLNCKFSFNPNQSGFMPGDSCIFSLFQLPMWYIPLDASSPSEVRGVFFYISKAFYQV